MIRSRKLSAAIQLIVILTWTLGCNEGVVEVAREAADRQAAQNQQMGELQKEVARGSRSLVEAAPPPDERSSACTEICRQSDDHPGRSDEVASSESTRARLHCAEAQ